jgi:integrase
MVARASNRLTDKKVQNLDEPGRHADGNGLYLNVRPGLSRQWLFRFRWQGDLREMSLGAYPTISLKAARDLAIDAKRLVAGGVNPLAAKREAKTKASAIPKFGDYALALLDRIEGGFRSIKHRRQWRQSLEDYCKPIWATPLNKVDTAGVLSCLAPIWQSKPIVATRLRGRIERVLNAARAEKFRAGENPAAWKGHLDATLPKITKLKRGHHPALAYAYISSFLSHLRGGEAQAGLALEFLILTATRTNETLGMRWSEVDTTAALWTIPAERTKAKKVHRVPLSVRALSIVQALGETRASEFVFPGRLRGKSLSSSAFLMLLRRVGRTDITAHGFRSAFRDWAGNETHFPRDVAEAALGHAVGDSTELAYRRGDALEKRRAMMEAWAQWCEPKAGSNVVPFGKAAMGAPAS